MKKQFIALVVLALGALACGSQEPRPPLNLYPTPNAEPTQTPFYIIHTQTPNATHTPVVVVVSATPNAEYFCITANSAVYLRPSPSVDNYPIVSIPSGSVVVDLGGRNGKWYFVELGEYQGWVNSEYLGNC